MSDKSSLCALPFVHLNLLATGNASLCCLSNDPLVEDGRPLTVRTHTLEQIWNSKALADIRAKMLKGDAVHNCRDCIKSEKKGFGSHRIEKTDLFLAKDDNSPNPLQIAASELSTVMPKPYYFDLRFDNLCNLKCVICNGSSSSRIENDVVHSAWTLEPAIVRTPNRFGTDKDWLQSDEFIEELKAIGSDARYIQMAGGEPFMSRIGMSWVKDLCDTGSASSIVLKIYTNLTRLDEKIIDLLAHFKRVELTLSIDGVGSVYEWVRFPGKWDVVEKNATMLEAAMKTRLKNATVCVNATMSIFSALSITDVFEFAKRHGFDAHLNNANWPHYTSARYMPPSEKDKLEQRLNDYAERTPYFHELPIQIKQWMADIRSVDVSSRRWRGGVTNVMRFANDMDASRGTDVHRTCPEIVDGLKRHCDGWDARTRYTSENGRRFGTVIPKITKSAKSYVKRMLP